MYNIRHIHEVILMMQKDERANYENEEALIDDIFSKFGKNVKFTSCSNFAFSITEVMPFLLEREKIILNKNGSIQLNPSLVMCDGHLK